MSQHREGLSGNVALFDLDRTITRYATFTPFLLGFAARHRPWMLLTAPAVLGAFVAYRFGLTSRTRLKSFMLRLMVGTPSEAVLHRYAEDFAEAMVLRQVYDGARKAIADHKDQGARLVMATASFDFIAKPIAHRLGFDVVIATQSEFVEGRLRPAVAGENCYGLEKLRRVEHFLHQEGEEWADTAFYTDHHTDIPLLQRSGLPCPVNTSSKLEVWARQNGVTCTDWRSE